MIIQGAGASTSTMTEPSGWTPIIISGAKCKASPLPPDWTASNAYTAPTTILPTVGNAGGFVFSISSNCTSGATEPVTWNQTSGGTQTDGTCTWTDIGVNYELQLAAAYRIANEPSPPVPPDAPGTPLTWSWTGSFVGSMVNDVFNNVSATTPLDVTGTATCTNGIAGANIPAAKITPTVANDAIVALYGASGAGSQITLPLVNPLLPIVSENDFGFGPTNNNAWNATFNLGAGPSYGPYGATQTVAGETVAVLLSLQP